MSKHWGQITVGLVGALLSGFYLIEQGSPLLVVVAFAVTTYIVLRRLFTWGFRVRYWRRKGTRGHYSTSCPDCGQYIYRQSGDWILKCKRCGWTVGLPGLRWLTHSVPARQLRRTVVSPNLVVVVIALLIVVAGVEVGTMVGGNGLSENSTIGSSPSAHSEGGSNPSQSPDTENDYSASTNPWGKESVVVAVRNQASPSENFTAAVSAALEYWSVHDEYGVYSVVFELDPDARTPDLIVWYNESINCENSWAAGCAPLLNSSAEPSPPEHVQIKYNRTSNFRQTRNTIIHEFGHVLGLGHCIDPFWVMGHHRYCEPGSVSLPDAAEKDFAWRDDSLTYYVDYSGVTRTQQTRDQVRHAIQYFEKGAGGTVPENVTFARVESEWEADILIRFGDCDEDYSACPQTWHSDPDSDGKPEFHTKTEILIDEPDVEARGWYVGWSLANSLTPDSLPPVFVDASYEERRSNWWG